MRAEATVLLDEGRAAQAGVHKWGEDNQSFVDESKESMHIVSRQKGDGTSIRLPGVLFGAKLIWAFAIHELVLYVRW